MPLNGIGEPGHNNRKSKKGPKLYAFGNRARNDRHHGRNERDLKEEIGVHCVRGTAFAHHRNTIDSRDAAKQKRTTDKTVSMRYLLMMS